MRSSDKKRKTRQTCCFICGTAGFSARKYRGLMVDGRSYDIVFCKGCRLGRTDPFLDEEKLNAIYSSTYRENDSTRFFAPVEKLVRFLRAGRSRGIEKYSQKGKILDIGCGRGDFLAMMAAKGWVGYGLELDKRVESHSSPGITLRYGGIGDVKFPDSYFDAVTLWHSFEHMREPEKAVTECRRVLKREGLLMIAVPNSSSIQARLAGKSWFHLDPPYHLYHYSSGNLTTLLSRCGFEVLDIRHFSFEYNPYGYIQSIYNFLGFRTNLLYDFLRSRGEKDLKAVLGMVFIFLTLPLVAPLSIIMSLIEAAAKAGGTIEVYARKKGA